MTNNENIYIGGNDSAQDDRTIWINIISKIANPVLINASNKTLKRNMPVQYIQKEKIKFSYLEAIGRLVCGMAPWLELGPNNSFEGKLRYNYIRLVINSLINICNPKSDDYLVFSGFHQPLVDTAFLTQGILRAKTQIWDRINDENQKLILNTLKQTRTIEPYNTNWLLFASMIEAFFLETTGKYKKRRLFHGIHKFMNNWYCGDGFYNDGNFFHFDYYNSFVIHPMITDVLLILNKHDLCPENYLNIQLDRLKQYSSHLERLISPDGTYPIIGRSMSYRTGAFHALSQACLLGLYGNGIRPGQVRAALTQIIKKQFYNNKNFNSKGWLTLGFNGNQIELSEPYINTGSLYLCSTIFLPLGLSSKNPFWADPYSDWSSLKGWSGKKLCSTKPIDNYNENIENNSNLRLIKLSEDFITARVDIKNNGNKGNSLLIENISDNKSFIDYPKWFCDENGEGLIIHSIQGELDLTIKCIGEGELNIIFRSKDVKDKHGKRFPIYIDYYDININNKPIIHTNKLVRLDRPYILKKNVTSDERIALSFKWLPFNKSSTYDE